MFWHLFSHSMEKNVELGKCFIEMLLRCTVRRTVRLLHRHYAAWSPNWEHELNWIQINCSALIFTALEYIDGVSGCAYYGKCKYLIYSLALSRLFRFCFDWSLLRRMRTKIWKRDLNKHIALMYCHECVQLCSPASLNSFYLWIRTPFPCLCVNLKCTSYHYSNVLFTVLIRNTRI